MRVLATAFAVLLAGCDDEAPPPPRPGLVLKEFAPPSKVKAPAVVAAAPGDTNHPPRRSAPTPRPVAPTMTRAELLTALTAKDEGEGCVRHNPWSPVAAQLHTPQTLAAVIALLDEAKRTDVERYQLRWLLRHQTDEVARAYWRSVLPGVGVIDGPVDVEESPIALAVSALMVHGTAEDRQRLTGWVGQSEQFDRVYGYAARQLVSDEKTLSPEIKAALQGAFDNPNSTAKVRLAAFSTLAMLRPTPTETMRAAMSDSELRHVSISHFRSWFQPRDLGLLDALSAADPKVGELVDEKLAGWFVPPEFEVSNGTAVQAPYALARERLVAVREAKVPAHFPRTLMTLALWATQQNDPELAAAVHRLAAAAASDKQGTKAAHQACLAALDGRGPITLNEAESPRWAVEGAIQNTGNFKPQAALCLKALPAPPKPAPVTDSRPQALRRLVDATTAVLEKCAADAVQRDPTLNVGRVEVVASVAPSGKVTAVNINPEKYRTTAWAGCMRKLTARVVFPKEKEKSEVRIRVKIGAPAVTRAPKR